MKIEDFFKIPDIFSFNKFLIFEPHPDDADLFMGGFIKKLTDLKKEVILITVTDGCKGTYDPTLNENILREIRKEERLNSSFLLGIKETIFLDYEDYNLPDKKVLVKEFIKIIRESRPDIVFTVDPFLTYEVHPDHISVGKAVSEAFFFSPMPLIYKEFKPFFVNLIGFYVTQYPNFFVDITDTFDFKLQAIKKHKSQFSEEDFQKLEIYLELKNGEYGSKIGAKYGEAFKILSPLLLHANVDSSRI